MIQPDLPKSKMNFSNTWCGRVYAVFNSFGAKFQMTFVVCFFYFNKLPFGKKFICKVERLNVKQHRSR